MKKLKTFDIYLKGRIFIIIKSGLTNLIVPSAFIFLLVYGKYNSIMEWSFLFIGVSAIVLYSFITGIWDWCGYYIRFALLIILLLTGLISMVSSIGLPFFMGVNFKMWLGAFIFLIFAPLDIISLRGSKFNDSVIKAKFPFQHGIFYIAQGGNSFIMNVHYRPISISPIGFALDIVKLNRFGFRAKGIYPKSLSKYYIFGELVFSPFDGKVIRAINNLRDMQPGERDLEHPAGNYVSIKHSTTNVCVFLMHLKQSSLLVREGDWVISGQPVGKIGNSGNSTEPHLHIHCESDTNGEDYLRGKAMALLFDDRLLKRNDVVWC